MTLNRIAFQTFGCKLNFAESSTLARQFREDGYEVVDHKDDADIYVINSCVVTANAEKKCRAAIRQARKRRADATIAIVGCFSQMAEDSLSGMKEVDLVLGTEEKFHLKDYLKKGDRAVPCFTQVGDIGKSQVFTPSWSSGDRTRSFLKIQDGCDYSCSFCTIPLARGKSRSDTIENVVSNAREIAKSGVREIVLTGVNTGDFGIRDGERQTTFLDLVQELDKIENIERIRISSIEPNLLSHEIINFVASSRKFSHHFHIPLQSGSNKILKSMRRRYLRELYLDRVEKIKSVMLECCIGVDVIVGFPGETDEDFLDTYNFINEMDISYLHVFTYSERPNTHAIKLDGVVSQEERKKRSKMLRTLSEKIRRYFYDQFVGQKLDVLFEKDIEGGKIHGFTDNYIRVAVPFQPGLVNHISTVKLTHVDPSGIMHGELVRNPVSV